MSFISYFITDFSYPLSFLLTSIKKHKPTFVCYRNKKYFNRDEIVEFAKFSKKYSKVIINIDDLKDEKLLDYFDGVHITSSKLDKIYKFKHKIIIASTHNIEEVKKAKDANFITFSPIFDSKGRKGLGPQIIEKIYPYHKNIIALGGIISDKEVEQIKNTKAVGFGSIRYFLK